MANAEVIAIRLAQAMLEVVQECGEDGAPAGALYMGFVHVGLSLTSFEAIMGALVQSGRVTLSNNCYYPVDGARAVVYG